MLKQQKKTYVLRQRKNQTKNEDLQKTLHIQFNKSANILP